MLRVVQTPVPSWSTSGSVEYSFPRSHVRVPKNFNIKNEQSMVTDRRTSQYIWLTPQLKLNRVKTGNRCTIKKSWVLSCNSEAHGPLRIGIIVPAKITYIHTYIHTLLSKNIQKAHRTNTRSINFITLHRVFSSNQSNTYIQLQMKSWCISL